MNPDEPTATNAARHPNCKTTHATNGGATIAPTADPLLKIPDARARSRGGNHSATTFTPAGQLPDSPIPRRNRAPPSDHGPNTQACKSAAVDHHATVRP